MLDSLVDTVISHILGVCAVQMLCEFPAGVQGCAVR